MPSNSNIFKSDKHNYIIFNAPSSDKKNIQNLSHKSHEGEVCGFKLSNYSNGVQFFVCVVSVFSLFIIYGYCQEWLFRIEEVKKHGMFVTLMQFGFYSIFGMGEQFVYQAERSKVPFKSYMLLAFLTIGTMGLSNTSLGYLNYPTQVIFKSSKLIPVMIGGILIQGKKYTILDMVACLLMTIGLIFFTFADQKVSPNFDPTGVILISLALCADAAIGNVQELVLKKYHSNNSELVLYSYGIGFFYLLGGNVIFGNIFGISIFMLKNPLVIFVIFLFSITGYVGLMFVLHLVRTFGALIAVTVSTGRKAVTLVLSFLFFTKPFTTQYIWSGLLVLLGICLNVYSKNKLKINSYVSNFLERRRGGINTQMSNVV